MKILFVEDDDDKAQKVSSEISLIDGEIELIRAKSFTSALRCLVKSSDIDGVILDMSMPNYDHSQEPPENFAGRDLLRQFKLRKIVKPTFVVTMLDIFGSGSEELTISQLNDQLASEFSPAYLGIAYYSSAQESWKSQLSLLIDQMKSF
ncbi:hypothetical protein [Uliginosibacterium sp. 31-12]|uniref:hypothetical protein n=1 Tax=Uliginosibacterium sp. 31-12 TaxID=3062781 RepID=UPI0026E31CA5|nr:hypothetical protein [Uliginosibacterium sp. 31-12]MDO6387012.1 hypothetical protein [Uliginosibacterium sp. 31-12]